MSKIISSFVYAFASTTWQLYLAPLAEILNGTSFIAMRSIASKLVQSDELVRILCGSLRGDFLDACYRDATLIYTRKIKFR